RKTGYACEPRHHPAVRAPARVRLVPPAEQPAGNPFQKAGLRDSLTDVPRDPLTMARPVIALLSDFGLRDHYVAAMKAVILGICPDAALLDISHEIPAQDILAGALELEAIVSYLPAGTIVVAVVDPGVGSGRRGVAIEAGDIRFVGPDNGLFSLALARLPRHTAVSIEERR